MPATFNCPQCGYAVRAGRTSCPACGSDAETGWRSSEDVDYLSADIPDDEPLDEGRNGASHNSTVARLGVILLVVLLVVAISIPLLARLL